MPSEENTVSKVNGFSLFNEIESDTLRRHCRASVLAKIVADNWAGGEISDSGRNLVLEYFEEVLVGERQGLIEAFKIEVYKRGFEPGGK